MVGSTERSISGPAICRRLELLAIVPTLRSGRCGEGDCGEGDYAPRRLRSGCLPAANRVTVNLVVVGPKEAFWPAEHSASGGCRHPERDGGMARTFRQHLGAPAKVGHQDRHRWRRTPAFAVQRGADTNLESDGSSCSGAPFRGGSYQAEDAPSPASWNGGPF